MNDVGKHFTRYSNKPLINTGNVECSVALNMVKGLLVFVISKIDTFNNALRGIAMKY